jgi:hypothetical protein
VQCIIAVVHLCNQTGQALHFFGASTSDLKKRATGYVGLEDLKK